jgi:hypothetical protein
MASRIGRTSAQEWKRRGDELERRLNDAKTNTDWGELLAPEVNDLETMLLVLRELEEQATMRAAKKRLLPQTSVRRPSRRIR